MTEETMDIIENSTNVEKFDKDITESTTLDSTSQDQKEERSIVFEEAIEAILFAAGHPISYATLARVFETTPAKIKETVMNYAEIYNASSIPRGVILLTYTDSCQLCTKKYYLAEIRDALGIKKSGTLSTSSLEALAIVAYNQPVTRAFVDTLRRADSSYAMNNLIDRGLIESKGRLDAPGRPMLFGTTSDFLRAFGLNGLSELPKTTEEIQSMFEKVIATQQTEELVQEEIDLSDGIIDTTITEESDNNSEFSTENSSQIPEDEPSAEDDFVNDDI